MAPRAGPPILRNVRYRDAPHLDPARFLAARPGRGEVCRLAGIALLVLAWAAAARADALLAFAVLVVAGVCWLAVWWFAVGPAWRSWLVAPALVALCELTRARLVHGEALGGVLP